MKIIKLVLISAVLLFVGTPSVIAGTQNKQSILHPKGLLWKIEKPGERESFLYGTMHVGDSRVTSLSPEVERAFLESDHFVMEMLLNFKSMGLVTSASFFNDGSTLQEVMRVEEYKSLTNLLNKRIFLTEKVLKNMKPWAVLMMLMIPVEQQLQASAVLDMVLFRRASLRKIEVTGLETAQEQIAVFESMSIEDQVWMLNRSIKGIDSTDAQMPNMLNAYLQRDLEQLVLMQRKFMVEDSEIDDRFMYQLLELRNKRMADRMEPVLKQGNAFIAIGALHLPGENGVLHLLEQQGYSVKALY